MDSKLQVADSAVNHLRYRRQFLLSTDPGHVLPGSGRVLVAGCYHVSAHPDLELTHVERDGKSLTLLGFALDPDSPQSGNERILLHLMDFADSPGEIIRATDTLGGRWVLIVHNGRETMVLQDATGQRQVYYVRDPKGGTTVCASEVGVMAEQLGLTMDADAVDFIRSRKSDDFEIYWMPGDTSLYAGIAALLPNHYLSLVDGSCHRFPPLLPPAPMTPPQALAECVRLLKGQIESARARYPLAIPMTAGWDSRLMLALNQDHAADIYAFTLAYPHLPAGSMDVAVPARLLEKLGIGHHVIPYPKTLDAAFKEIFRQNNASANNAYCGDIQALHVHYPGERVCVTGDAAEIVKCYYERTCPQKQPVSAAELAEFSRLGKHPFAVRAFGRWLEDAGSPPIDLLDLFCWEQMAGRWQSKIRAEFDMVQESFAPLNNRRLLGILLSVDADRRRAPGFGFFADLIEALWPEALSEPINPPESLSRSRRVLNVIRKTGVLKLVPDAAKEKVREMLR